MNMLWGQRALILVLALVVVAHGAASPPQLETSEAAGGSLTAEVVDAAGDEQGATAAASAQAELAEAMGSVGVDVRTLNPKHRPTLLTHRKRHPGRQPNVVPTDREHAEYYLSDFCKQPVVKYNPPNHQYLPEGSVSRDGADASVRVVNETSIASSAPRVTGDAGVGARRLLTARPTKRARPNKKKKKAKGAIQVSPRIDGWNAAHPNANDYKILQTAVRNRGAFCPWMTRECVQPEAARTAARWVKGNAYSCCQGDDRSCCSQRMPRMIPEPSVSRAEWEQLPSIPPGHWGSCALVAIGGNLLEDFRGAEIDAHDLVIRYGHAPLGEYSKHVGSRTDVVLSRTGTRMTAEYAYHTQIKFHIMPKPAELDRDHQCHPLNAATETRQVHCLFTNQVDAPPVDALQVSGEHMSPRILPKAIYAAMTDPFGPKPRGATSGFNRAMPFVFSDACRRVDLYGFSNNGGPYYYNLGQSLNLMKQHHSAELESWVFHSLMRNYSNELHTCVHI